MPGETVQIDFNGNIYINGEVLDEHFGKDQRTPESTYRIVQCRAGSILGAVCGPSGLPDGIQCLPGKETGGVRDSLQLRYGRFAGERAAGRRMVQ